MWGARTVIGRWRESDQVEKLPIAGEHGMKMGKMKMCDNIPAEKGTLNIHLVVCTELSLEKITCIYIYVCGVCVCACV